jgi:hypothetical protein
MKKFNLLNNAAKSLLVVGMSLVIFTGCQSKTAQSTSDKTAKVAVNTADMKKKMGENIASLVTDKTITQSQADKVLEVLLSSQMFSGKGRSQNGQTNNQQNPKQNDQEKLQPNDQQTTKPNDQTNGNPNANGSNNANRQMANPLSNLVATKVITQAQSNAIMEKVRGNLGRPKSN